VQRGNGIVFFAYLNMGLVVSAAVANAQPVGIQNPIATIALVNMPDSPPTSASGITISTANTKPTRVNAPVPNLKFSHLH